MRARRFFASAATAAMVAGGLVLAAAPSALAIDIGDCGAPAAPYVDWHNCDKSGADLAGADLNHANLANTNLNDANLSHAKLFGAYLYGAQLARADVSGADLHGADFTDGDLNHANAAGVDFTGAIINGVDFYAANVTGSTMVETHVDGTYFFGATLTCVVSSALQGTPADFPAGWSIVDAALSGPGVGPCGGGSTPIPSWVQGYGRGSSADACQAGWQPSWEMWPHGGTGGYVCTRSIPSLG